MISIPRTEDVFRNSHRLLVVPEPEGPQGAPHRLGVPDLGADLLHGERARRVFGRNDGRVVRGSLPPDCRITSHLSSPAWLVRDLVHLDAALARDLAGRDQRTEAVHGGPHHVVRVGRAKALGQDVGDAGALEHRAHRSAGDDAGTGGGRLQQHPAGAVLADHLVRNGGAGPRQLDHRALGRIHGLAHRFGDLVRLAGCDADLALAVADRHQGVEGEPASALDHLGDAVDGNDVLDVIAGAIPIAAVPSRSAPTTPVTPLATTPTPAARPVVARGPFGNRRRVARAARLGGAALGDQAAVLGSAAGCGTIFSSAI